MRVAIYARVSKDDGSQNAANQLSQLRQWCAGNGHSVALEYVDHESGGRGAEHRPALSAMLHAAQNGKPGNAPFELVLFWAIDRLSREGMVATIAYLQTLAGAGVAFHSYSEPALCSDNELVRDIVLAVMSSLAKAERLRISARTMAGLERVRREGSRSGRAIGRPALAGDLAARIAELRAANPHMAAYAISRRVGVDPKTVRKYLAAHKPEGACLH
jgi:DNA invertase Pin-like site-specific DNA recombinase